MKRLLIGLIAASMLTFAAPAESDARPRYYRWGPRPYYRSYYAYPYRAYRPYYRSYYRPYYRPYYYRPYAYGYWGPRYYYRGPGISIGVY